uniref:COMM domain containing 4 n=1 Tax=Cyprinodon variegatus TaxID=28743 RepID=A0A3Q2E7F4_CYPVA
ISTLAKISSVKMKLLCAQVLKDLLGEGIDFSTLFCPALQNMMSIVNLCPVNCSNSACQKVCAWHFFFNCSAFLDIYICVCVCV